MVPPTFIRSCLSFLIAISILLVVSTAQDTSAENADLHAKFDSIIKDWQQNNPTLAPQISDDDIELLFQSVFSNSTISRRSQLGDIDEHRQARELYKRQNVTVSELTAARSMVANALAKQGKFNNQTLANPRRNVNAKKPSGSTTQAHSSILSSPLTANKTLASAITMVAEADAAILAQQGKLFKDYTLPGKFAKYNLPGTPTGSKHNKRASSSWFLPALASNAPGSLPFSGSKTPIWRNVLDYGAVGDGVHDDTAAINDALYVGCVQGCSGTTTRGAAVYLPPGVYLVSSPIILEYNTQLVGDATSLPVILAAPGFAGLGVISSDVYIPGGSGAEWYLNTDNFYRQVRNLVIDLLECTTPQVAAIHWQVAQATSLQNIEIVMSTAPGTTQVGIYAENGSGGFMSDILIYGGNLGMQCGNQQFTSRNMIFVGNIIGIYMIWDWGWTFKSITFESVQNAFWMESTIVGGSIHLLDSTMNGITNAGIVMYNSVGATQQEQVLITIDNLVVDQATIVVFDLNAGTFLETSGAQTIPSWVIGKQYDNKNPNGIWVNGAALDTLHPTSGSLMGGPNGGYFESSKPQYTTLSSDKWISLLEFNPPIVGDGKTDVTAALSLAFFLCAGFGVPLFIPTGSYIITSTVLVPVNSILVGSLWSQLVASGAKFNDLGNPIPMIQVGKPGDTGAAALQDLLFTTTGTTAGAILVEWNIEGTTPGATGMWDCHFRVGGAIGTELQVAQCPGTKVVSYACFAATLLFHVIGNGYFENVWAWTADHDIDDPNQTQLNVFTLRSVLIESKGPSWFYATAAEHSLLYQYNIANASDIYLGMIQTESPYYAPLLLPSNESTYTISDTTVDDPYFNVFPYDPDFSPCTNSSCDMPWALTVSISSNIQVLGAGLYSWYNDVYSEACVDSQNCQLTLVHIEQSSGIYIYNLYTIGSVNMVTTGALCSTTMDTVTAVANQVESAHPYLSALNAWITVSEDTGNCEIDITSDTEFSLPNATYLPAFELEYVEGDILLFDATGAPNFFLAVVIDGPIVEWEDFNCSSNSADGIDGDTLGCIAIASSWLAYSVYLDGGPEATASARSLPSSDYHFQAHSAWQPVENCTMTCMLLDGVPQHNWTSVGNGTYNGIFHELHFMHTDSFLGYRAAQKVNPDDSTLATRQYVSEGNQLNSRTNDINVEMYSARRQLPFEDTFDAFDSVSGNQFGASDWMGEAIEEAIAMSNSSGVCVSTAIGDEATSSTLWGISQGAAGWVTGEEEIDRDLNRCINAVFYGVLGSNSASVPMACGKDVAAIDPSLLLYPDGNTEPDIGSNSTSYPSDADSTLSDRGLEKRIGASVAYKVFDILDTARQTWIYWYSAPYTNGANGQTLQNAGGDTHVYALADKLSCTDTSLISNAPIAGPGSVTVNAEHLFERVTIAYLLEFAQTLILDLEDGNGKSIVPGASGLTPIPFTIIATWMVIPYAQWHPLAGIAIDPTKSLFTDLAQAIGSTLNNQVMTNLEAGLNRMKARVWDTIIDPTSDDVWDALASNPTGHNTADALKLIRAGIAVFNYVNAPSNQLLFGAIFINLLTAAAQFDTYYSIANSVNPNFTQIVQVFVNAWVTRMANHFRSYALARLVILEAPWKTIINNEPSETLAIFADAQINLIAQVVTELYGMSFNTAPFVSIEG